MDDKLAIKTLKRVHDSAVHAEQTEAPAIADQFNEVLSSLKSEFPDNETIQSMEEVQASSRPQGLMKGSSKIEKVKLKTEQIADTLGLGDDFDRPTKEDEMPMISLEYAPSQENIQEAHQEANPEMTQEANQEGNTGHGPTATPSGTRGRYWRTCWRPPTPAATAPLSSRASSTTP